VIDQAVRDRNLHSPADKAAAVEEALPFVRAVRDRIQKREYFDITMDALRIHAKQRQELWQRVRTGATTDAATVQQQTRRTTEAASSEQRVRAGQNLVQLLLAEEEVRQIVLTRLESRDYEDLPTAEIFRAMIRLNDEGAEINFSSLSGLLADDPTASELLSELSRADKLESFPNPLATADGCVNALRAMSVERRIDELKAEIGEAVRAGDSERVDRLVMEQNDLAKKISRLISQRGRTS
jgi:DNA primase